MKLDLRTDFQDIYSYLIQRVRTFDPSANAGPGDGASPISQIDFGYQCDQAGWVALVFDTRPDAEPDGEWNSYIEANILERPHWQAAYEALETEPVEIIFLDGITDIATSDSNEEAYMAIFGDLLKNVLEGARRRCSCHYQEPDDANRGGRAGWPVRLAIV